VLEWIRDIDDDLLRRQDVQWIECGDCGTDPKNLQESAAGRESRSRLRGFTLLGNGSPFNSVVTGF
jgi:hypothetical protein